MFIDITNNTLIIDDSSSELRAEHISQIYYWGFVKDIKGNIYKYSSEIFDSVLIKLIKYVDGEKIPYSISQPCQEFIAILNQAADNFEKIKLRGKDYKDGEFDIVEFNNFSSFANKKVIRQLKAHQLKAAYHLYLLGVECHHIVDNF